MTNDTPQLSTMDRRMDLINGFLGPWADKSRGWFLEVIGMAPPTLTEPRWVLRFRLFVEIWQAYRAAREQWAAMASSGLADIESGAPSLTEIQRNMRRHASAS